jgi:small subunit ribosomal protein S20
VAHSLSAKKRVRQNIKARARNRHRKEQIKDTVKAYTSALTTGALDKAVTALNDVARRLDKVAAKGTIHKNQAARKRSRLTKRLNAARKTAAAGGGKGAKAGAKA